METSQVRAYEAGATIFREGDKGEVMYVLLEGAVELKRKVERGEAVLKVVNVPNDFFGEMALLDDRPRSASAVAETACKLLVVDRPSFESMILQNGKFALKIIKVLSERIRRSNDQVSDLIETMPRDRIARGMVDFALKAGEAARDGSYKVSATDMTSWINSHLGIAREELDAAVFRFVKAGAIFYSPKDKDLILLPPDFVRVNGRRGLDSEEV